MAKTTQRKEILYSSLDLPGMRDWHAIAAIILLVSFFFRDILLQNAYFWEDFLYQFYPFRYFAAVSMAKGELPLWNPYTFCGTPFQADIQSALFYVPNMLLTLFVSGGKLHFFWVEFLIILHYMIAGVGMYYLARDFGFERIVSLFSAVVFTLSGFMITHAIHQVVICQVAWLPLVFLLFRHALLRKSLLSMIIGGLVLGHAVLAGFPQLSLYIFFFLFLYFLFEFFSTLKIADRKAAFRMVPFAAGMIMIAIAVTALQLLPTLELAPLSQRAEITYEKSQEGMLTWSNVITALVPKFFGSSGAQGSNYWGPGAYWSYWETCFYIGIPALLLSCIAGLAFRRDRYIAFFASVSIFSLLYAVGDNFIIHKFFFYIVPGFNKFRSIGRITLLLTFSAALLSGYGLRLSLEILRSHGRQLRRVLMIAAGVAALLWIGVQGGMFQPGGDRAYEQIHSFAVGETTNGMLFVLAACAILLLWMRRTVSSVAAIILLLLVQVIDINIFGFNQNNGPTNPQDYYNRTSQLVGTLKEEGQKEYFRINSRQGGAMVLDRNQGMVDEIFMMEGYTPLALQRLLPPLKDWDSIRDLMNVKYRISVDQQRQTMGLEPVATYLPRAFLVYHSTVIPDEHNVQTYMQSAIFDPRRTVVFEQEPEAGMEQSPDSAAGGTAIITSYHLNSIELTTQSPKNGWLVLSEIYYPGWTAKVDETPTQLLRADWNLRAIPIPAGSHHVEAIFEPQSFHRGLWITFATIGISVLGIVYSLRKKPKPPSDMPRA